MDSLGTVLAGLGVLTVLAGLGCLSGLAGRPGSLASLGRGLPAQNLAFRV